MSTFNLSQNHIYSLYIQNMEYGTLDHYNIAWTLVDRNNKVVGTLEEEQLFNVRDFMLEDGVQYMLMAELTFDKLKDYKESASTYFTVHAPPVKGQC